MVSRVTEGGFRTSVDPVLRVFSPSRQLSGQQSLAKAQLSLTLEGTAVSLFIGYARVSNVLTVRYVPYVTGPSPYVSSGAAERRRGR